MPLVKMGPMLRDARTKNRAVAAVNIIDFNSARSVIDCAQELSVPVITQVSVKTCPSSYKVGRQSGLSTGGSGSFV